MQREKYEEMRNDLIARGEMSFDYSKGRYKAGERRDIETPNRERESNPSEKEEK